MDKEKLEVSYAEPNNEKELADWLGKTVKSAKVVHYGSDGKLTIEFTDGITRVYWFNEMTSPSGMKKGMGSWRKVGLPWLRRPWN